MFQADAWPPEAFGQQQGDADGPPKGVDHAEDAACAAGGVSHLITVLGVYVA